MTKEEIIQKIDELINEYPYTHKATLRVVAIKGLTTMTRDELDALYVLLMCNGLKQ